MLHHLLPFGTPSTAPVSLPNDDPEVFESFLSWLYQNRVDDDLLKPIPPTGSSELIRLYPTGPSSDVGDHTPSTNPEHVVQGLDVAPLLRLYLLASKYHVFGCQADIIKAIWGRFMAMRHVSLDTCALLEKMDEADGFRQLMVRKIASSAPREEFTPSLIRVAPGMTLDLLKALRGTRDWRSVKLGDLQQYLDSII